MGGTISSLQVDLSTGMIINQPALSASVLGSSVTSFGNGWFRLSISVSETDPIFQIAIPDSNWGNNYVGNGVDSIYLWGAQVEVGSFPTSYIKTEASTVTRGSESMTRTLGQEWNPNEGTFVVEFELKALITDTYIVAESTTKRWLYLSGSGSLSVFDGLSVVDSLFYPLIDTKIKACIASNTNSKSLSINGITPITAISNGGLLSASIINLLFQSDKQSNGTIKRLTYYPKAFDAATLQKLSRIS
jgi:hypothetical protein